MFPISDDNPTLRTPVVTYALLATLLVIFVFVQGGGGYVGPDGGFKLIKSVCDLGLVPAELLHTKPVGFAVPMAPGVACEVDNSPINPFTPLTSMFLHGGWAHLLGNSLYLWVFGNNVEDSMGRGRFLAFYLLCGLVAAATHVLFNPGSAVPTVGASGAISGVLGGYLVLYPRVRVRTFFPPFFLFHVPAWAYLIFWFGSQALTGLRSLSPMRPDASAGVAVWAHIGGFVAGFLLIKVFASGARVARRSAGGDARAAFDPAA
jgi:membrane associated rhomboid family serine protease